MTYPKFTPSPWELGDWATVWPSDSEHPVAECASHRNRTFGKPSREEEANAQLIAAAPELFAAAEAALVTLKSAGIQKDVRVQLEAALAKAKGETT